MAVDWERQGKILGEDGEEGSGGGREANDRVSAGMSPPVIWADTNMRGRSCAGAAIKTGSYSIMRMRSALPSRLYHRPTVPAPQYPDNF